MLSATELAAMRATLNASLPDTAQVQTLTRTADGMGGYTESWTLGASYSCRLSSRGVPQEYLQQAAVQGAQYWMVTLPYNAAVTRQDRLIVGGKMLSIVGFQSGGAWETAKRVVCVEVN